MPDGGSQPPSGLLDMRTARAVSSAAALAIAEVHRAAYRMPDMIVIGLHTRLEDTDEKSDSIQRNEKPAV